MIHSGYMSNGHAKLGYTAQDSVPDQPLRVTLGCNQWGGGTNRVVDKNGAWMADFRNPTDAKRFVEGYGAKPAAPVHALKAGDLGLSERALSELAHGFPVTPWGIGSRRKDAFAFARAAVQMADAEAARRLRELTEALDAFDAGGFSEAKVIRINAARKAAREYIAGASAPQVERVRDPGVVAVTEDLWQAIIDWQAASRALEKRREAKELMNADYIDRVTAAEERIDFLIARAVAPARPVSEAVDFSAVQPWDDLKVAFGLEDSDKFEAWVEKTRAFYSDNTAGFPKGWELIEMNGEGARYVAIFRVQGGFRPQDGATVAKLLSEVGGYPYDDAAPAAKQGKSGPSL